MFWTNSVWADLCCYHHELCLIECKLVTPLPRNHALRTSSISMGSNHTIHLSNLILACSCFGSSMGPGHLFLHCESNVKICPCLLALWKFRCLLTKYQLVSLQPMTSHFPLLHPGCQKIELIFLQSPVQYKWKTLQMGAAIHSGS